MTYEQFRKRIGEKAYNEGHYSIVDALPRAVFTDIIESMATNSKNIFINPSWLDHLSADEIIGVLFHELFHDIYGHTSPSWAVYDANSGISRGKWYNLCNIAQDAVINEQILQLGLSLPKEGIFKKDLGIPDNLSTAHEIFRKLLEDVKASRNTEQIANAARQVQQQEQDNKAVQGQPLQRPSKNGYPVGSPKAAKKKSKTSSSSGNSSDSLSEQSANSQGASIDFGSDSVGSSNSEGSGAASSGADNSLAKNSQAQQAAQKEQKELEKKKDEIEKEIEKSKGSDSFSEDGERETDSDNSNDKGEDNSDEEKLQKEKEALDDALAANKEKQEQLKKEEQELEEKKKQAEQEQDSSEDSDEDAADDSDSSDTDSDGDEQDSNDKGEDNSDEGNEDDYYDESEKEADSSDEQSDSDSENDESKSDNEGDFSKEDDSTDILDEVRQQLKDLYADQLMQKITQVKSAERIYKPVLPKKQSWVDIVFQSAGKYLSTIDRTRTYQRRSHRPAWGLPDQDLKTPFKGSRPGDFKPRAWFYIDVSGSMYTWNPATDGYTNVPDEIRAELAKHVHMLRDTQSVVIPFNNGLFEPMDVTKEMPHFGGGTNLYRVIESINTSRNKYDVFVVVTDCDSRFNADLIDKDKRVFIVTQYPELVSGGENRNITVLGVDRF